MPLEYMIHSMADQVRLDCEIHCTMKHCSKSIRSQVLEHEGIKIGPLQPRF